MCKKIFRFELNLAVIDKISIFHETAQIIRKIRNLYKSFINLVAGICEEYPFSFLPDVSRQRLTTGKNEKVHSLHVSVINFIGKQQLV